MSKKKKGPTPRKKPVEGQFLKDGPIGARQIKRGIAPETPSCECGSRMWIRKEGKLRCMFCRTPKPGIEELEVADG